MIPLLVTCSTLILLYVLFMLWIYRGLSLLQGEEKTFSKAGDRVSVIIPFKNEASNLKALIGDLAGQDYPLDKFTVYLVNDHSTDTSASLVRDMIDGLPNFSLLTLPGGMHGKKEALKLAVDLCSTDWIIQTDGDCRIGREFISSHMAFAMSSHAELVAGWVLVEEGQGGFLNAFERLETLSLAASGAASFAQGRALMCSGANLLYTRELFISTRSFDPQEKIASGDDMFLLIGARKLQRRLAFNPHPHARVHTAHSGSWKALIGQRIRWGSKSVNYGKGDIQVVALLVFLTNILVFSFPVILLLFPDIWAGLLLILGVKSVADFLVLKLAARVTEQEKLLNAFLPVSLTYYPFMLACGIGSLLGKSPWKDNVS